MSVRDAQRAKVYAAEEFVRTVFDQAAEHGSRSIEFFGTRLTLLPEGRFGSVPAVQRYVNEVLALPAVRRRWPAASTLTVPRRRGSTAAHYENRAGVGVIAVPDRRDADWVMRELVVLHEVAHHLGDGGGNADTDPPHGPEFVETLCTLAELVMGPEVGHVLPVVYAKAAVG